MASIMFAWFIGLAFYALAWACPFVWLAAVGYGLSFWFFSAACIQAWLKARE